MSGGNRERAVPLEELLAPLLETAYGTAFRLTGDATAAEDLVLRAAARAQRAFHTFEPGTHFRVWFFRILASCFQPSPDIGAGDPVLPSREEDPAAWLDRVEPEVVGRAVARLPVAYRVATALHLMQGCSYREVAEILGVTIGTTRSVLHGGRRMLRGFLRTGSA